MGAHDALRRRRAELPWALATPLVVLVAACLPLLRVRDFYFRDDSELGAFPIWYHLGHQLRAGTWPVLEPSAWAAGNLAAEGQWGLFSPLTMGLALLASGADSALAFSTAVKLVFLLVAASGTYLLARTYAVRPPLALVAGVAVPLNGFTLYMDAPSWVTGLMTWALLPWAWAALRLVTARRLNPLAFLVPSYLIVSIGYFHGALALGVVIIAVGVDRLWARDWRSVRTVVLAGVVNLLLMVAVYLPGVLTADVTLRDSQAITNTGFLNADLTSLLGSASPTGMQDITGFWGPFTTAPLAYVAWFLPLLALVAWSGGRRLGRGLLDVVVVGTTALAVLVGPSDLGPLRFPVRVAPYVALAVVLATVVVLDRAWGRAPAPRATARVAAAALATCYAGYVARPEQYGLITLATAAALLCGLGLAVVAFTAGAKGSRAALGSFAGVLALGSVLVTAAQLHLFPVSPLPHFDVPGQVAHYQALLPDAVNDVLVVGSALTPVDEEPVSRFDQERRPVPQPDATRQYDEQALGNLWMLTPARVQNRYSVLQFDGFSDLLCMDHRGETCPDLVHRLFRAQPRVFEPLVDLLAVDTLVLVKDQVPVEDRAEPPAGWSVAFDGWRTVVWTRDRPVGPAGGVVHTSAGTRVTELARSDREVRVRVDAGGGPGARMVLSRLAWPGYEVDGAQLAEEPLNGYLLDVDLSSAQPGDVVTVSFSPPGWSAVWTSWVLALVLGAAWSVLAVASARRGPRRRRERRAVAEPPAVRDPELASRH